MNDAQDVADQRVAALRRRLAAACSAAGRDTADVTVCAVSKTHPPEAVLAVADTGIVDLGENRVQELVAKRAAVDGVVDRSLQWHLVGPLQRNKVNDCIGTGLLVHTVDRRSLVDRMVRHLRTVDARQRVLVQVNVAGDPAKHGCALDDAEALVAYSSAQPELDVEGLMTIPPLPAPDEDPNAAARPHFARLRELRDRLAATHPDLTTLSMGMSSDLEAAVAEGATIVRLGTAVFGERGARAWQPLPPVTP